MVFEEDMDVKTLRAALFPVQFDDVKLDAELCREALFSSFSPLCELEEKEGEHTEEQMQATLEWLIRFKKFMRHPQVSSMATPVEVDQSRDLVAYVQTGQWGAAGSLAGSGCCSRVEGDVVEVGVWRGGMSAWMKGLLKFEHSDESRRLFMYDAFGPFPRPRAHRRDVKSFAAISRLFNDDPPTVRGVKALFRKFGLLDERVSFVKGDVADTLKADACFRRHAASGIALLRMDTDCYESTLRILRQLYPFVSKGGVVIVDDYLNSLVGCRDAVDQFRAEHAISDEIFGLDSPNAVYWFKSAPRTPHSPRRGEALFLTLWTMLLYASLQKTIFDSTDAYNSSQIVNYLLNRSALGAQPCSYSGGDLVKNEFPWSVELQRNWRAIRKEFDEYARSHRVPHHCEVNPTVALGEQDETKWKTAYLRLFEQDSLVAAESFPKTMALLDSFRCVLATFSVLMPGAVVPPHTGLYKGVLRYHLCLKTPPVEEEEEKGSSRCFLRVWNGEQPPAKLEFRLEEGEHLVFDDTFVHAAANESTRGDRVVLLLDFERDFSTMPLSRCLHDYYLLCMKQRRELADHLGCSNNAHQENASTEEGGRSGGAQ